MRYDCHLVVLVQLGVNLRIYTEDIQVAAE